MLKKILWGLFILLILLVLAYAVGPRESFEKIHFESKLSSYSISSLDSIISSREGKVDSLKPDNESRIVWSDSLKEKKEFALLYLHGFSASGEEGAPVHENFARKYGMNLYIPRLYDHGRYARNTFKDLTPQQLIDSALDALEIAKTIGNKVIIMSCSTGSTLSIALAAQKDPAIHSMIMYSPNIDLYDPASDMLLMPWGRAIAEKVMGGNYNKIEYPKLAQQYWNTIYHIDGLFAVQSLIEQTMTESFFSNIAIPVYLGCYFKDEEHQDKVVSVDAMRNFMSAIQTPDRLKVYEEFPNAGRHVIASYVMSNDLDKVKEETFDFADNVLKLAAVE